MPIAKVKPAVSVSLVLALALSLDASYHRSAPSASSQHDGSSVTGFFRYSESERSSSALVVHAGSGPERKLLEAVLEDDLSGVVRLLQKGVRANARGTILTHGVMGSYETAGTTPLMIATSNRSVPIMKMLIHSGASVGLRDEFGNSALRRAIESDSLEALRLILAAGADPNDGCAKGDVYPVHIAVLNGQDQIVSELLSHGADPNPITSRVGSQPRTAFGLACSFNRHRIAMVVAFAAFKRHVDSVTVQLGPGALP
jgi:hypothetical protein